MAAFGPGVSVGHWSDPRGRTGCTVVLFPEGTVASGEVRGGAPASREFALLEPGRLVDRLDAMVLSGGSAFGLASCDGVMTALADRGVGFPTPGGPVPIVVGLSLFDLGVGDANARPGPTEGAAAVEAATETFDVGQVGAGTGATTDKWRGLEHASDAGLGFASVSAGELHVAALFAVNAAGAIDDGASAAHIADGSFDWRRPGDDTFGNTTIGIVVTNAALDKPACRLLAESAHDGLARAIFPPHRRTDGDAVVAAATGSIAPPDLDQLRAMTVVAVEQAIRQSVGGTRLAE